MSSKSDLFPDFLRKARLKANLSQAQVGKVFGYGSAQYVSNWERGVSKPPLKTLRKLAELYGVPGDVLYEILLRETLRSVEESKSRCNGSFTVKNPRPPAAGVSLVSSRLSAEASRAPGSNRPGSCARTGNNPACLRSSSTGRARREA